MMKYNKYKVKSPDKDTLKVFQSILNKNNRRKNVYTSIFPVQVSINDGITKDKNIEDNKILQKAFELLSCMPFPSLSTLVALLSWQGKAFLSATDCDCCL